MDITASSILFALLTKLVSLTTDVDPIAHYEPTPEYIQEMHCLSLNTYFEARGEDFQSKLSVAQSVMHRINDDGEFKRHSTACGVVKRANRDHSGQIKLHQCWYSWYCDGNGNGVRLFTHNGDLIDIEKQAWRESIIASFYAYHNLHEDIVDGSTHYYNDELANPKWASAYQYVTRVGQHVFLK